MELISVSAQCGYQRMPATDAVQVDLREGKTASVVLKLHKGLW